MHSIILFLALSLGLSSSCNKKTEQAQQDKHPAGQTSSNVAEVLSVTVRPDMVPNFTWRNGTGEMRSEERRVGKECRL